MPNAPMEARHFPPRVVVLDDGTTTFVYDDQALREYIAKCSESFLRSLECPLCSDNDMPADECGRPRPGDILNQDCRIMPLRAALAPLVKEADDE